MQKYRFAEFELDLDAQELRANGQALHLERRPMNLLVMLVLARGKLVPREELIAALWPENVIIDFDAGLNIPGSSSRFPGAVTGSLPKSRKWQKRERRFLLRYRRFNAVFRSGLPSRSRW